MAEPSQMTDAEMVKSLLDKAGTEYDDNLEEHNYICVEGYYACCMFHFTKEGGIIEISPHAQDQSPSRRPHQG